MSEGRYWKEAGNFEIAQKSFSKGLARLGDGDLDKKRKDVSLAFKHHASMMRLHTDVW